MKIKILFLIIVVQLFLLIGCNCSNIITHEVLFRGFIQVDKYCDFPQAIVFENETQWNHFTSKYCPNLPSEIGRLDRSVDFSKSNIICDLSFNSAKPNIYSSSCNFDKIIIKDNILKFNWISDDKCNVCMILPNVNNKEMLIPFITVCTVNKKDTPSNISNIYNH